MINMTKGSSPVVLSKEEPIQVRITWPAATDYDAGCEILYKDGSTESIATFASANQPAKYYNSRGTVAHSGDVGRGEGMGEEIIEIMPDEEIEQIVPWAYSAQSNGTGSFYRHAVSMEVTAGNESVRIDATNASNNDTIYTCVPGIIRFRDEVPQVEYVEAYSSPGSESRPAFQKKLLGGRFFTMDGPKNAYK